MRESISADAIMIYEAPTECPGSIGIIKRYHAPLRCTYIKIINNLGDDIQTYAECLHMDVYVANATMEPEGLCPM